MLEEARKIVSLDIYNITEDIEKRIYRLETFLRKEIGAIPRTEDLVNWVFDKKKLKQTGDYFPKITDKELIEYLNEYNISLKREVHRTKHIEQQLNSFQWLGTPQQLVSLYTNLITEGFICSSSSFEIFQVIFSASYISNIREKVFWLKMGDNKNPNKKSVSDFINVLINKGFIAISSNLPKMLSHCFTFSTGDSKFTHSNLAKEGNYSAYRLTFEDIVRKL